MNLSRARRIVKMGQYAYPAACLGLAIAAWKCPDKTSEPAIPMTALAVAIVMWALLHVSAKWIDNASTERAELNNQLIQSQKVLALGEISTGIAHEINNPLNIIMQESELMRMTLDEPVTQESLEEVRNGLNVVLNQVERCSDITHKLLDFARKRVPVSQFADINRLVEDMLCLVEREAGPQSIQIVKAFDKHMPMVRTDPPLLRQVFLNLLINAVQAVDKGGLIFVSTYCEDDMACTEVRDTGPGIQKANIDRIFNPFFTTKPPGKGTGLGLSVSLRIINQLGGDIVVRSEPGKGAEFTVRIPLNP